MSNIFLLQMRIPGISVVKRARTRGLAVCQAPLLLLTGSSEKGPKLLRVEVTMVYIVTMPVQNKSYL